MFYLQLAIIAEGSRFDTMTAQWHKIALPRCLVPIWFVGIETCASVCAYCKLVLDLPKGWWYPLLLQ